MPTVRGNHERQVPTLPPRRMGASDRLAHEEATPQHMTWLASLPLTLEIAHGVLAFHGSRTDDLTYLLEDRRAARSQAGDTAGSARAPRRLLN